MIESLIITLREGIEIALVVGIVVVYLRTAGRTELLPSVYAGLVAAVLVSVGGAVLLEELAVDQESLEGWFMLVAAACVVSMVVWMWRTSRTISAEIRERVGGILQRQASLRVRLSVAGFVFFMVVREGIETALFLHAVAYSIGGWQSIAGTVAGVGLATAFGVVFVRGSVRIDIGRFLKVTAFTLILFALQLVINAVHEFLEYGLLPASPRLMGIVGPIVQHDTFFIAAIVAIPAFMLFIPRRRAAAVSAAQRRWQVSAGAASLLFVFVLGVGQVFSSRHDTSLGAEEIAVPPDGVIAIPAASAADGNLHRYAIRDDSLEIRFFIIRTDRNSYTTVFDACRACYSYGRYYLRKSDLICSQCDAPFPLAKMKLVPLDEPVDSANTGSMEGNGCAPIPLPSRLHNGVIEIRLSDLQHQRKYFDIARE